MIAHPVSIETPDQIVERLNAELRGKGPHEIIRVALREFGRKLTYVSSFGAESAAMLGKSDFLGLLGSKPSGVSLRPVSMM